MNPLVGIGGLGGTELLLIFLVIVLLFGAKKLPELARGSGQALRIFKAETKGLMDDDSKTDRQRQLDERDREAEQEFDRKHPVNRTEEPGGPGATG